MASDIFRGLLRAAGNGALRMNGRPDAASTTGPGASDPLSRGLPRDSAGRLLVAINAPISSERTFTETAGAGVYTATVSIPAGATIEDIIINGVALWDNSGTAVLKVGDAGNDSGYYAAVNLKATDLLAGESLSFALAGGKAGTYIANSQVSPRYSATARIVSAIVTTSSTGGGAGRTRMLVTYSAPIAADIAAATKV